MSMNVGINLVEVNGRASPAIQGAATSVPGFVIFSKRGVSGVVRQVTNYSQFVEYFGSYSSSAYGAYAVKGFFDNGGTLAYVTRVVATSDTTTAVAAFVKLNDGGGPAVDVLTVTAAYRGNVDKGTWANGANGGITVDVVACPTLTNAFNLVVKYNGTVVETWTELSITTLAGSKDPEATINNEFTGSKYISVTITNTSANPVAIADEPLAGGIDGAFDADETAQSAITTAFELFNSFDIQLLTCPESDDATVLDAVTAAGATYCETRGDCFYVGHTPKDHGATSAKAFGAARQADKVYGALYFPYILINDPLGTQKWIPPNGHILGVYGRTDRERGIWKAPAGNATSVRNALDLKYHIDEATHTDLVKNGSVNAVRFIPGQGIIIDSSRTLSTNTLWLYVNVRLLFNYVKSSLRRGLRWVVQEPNDPTLWNKVKYNTVTPFLMDLWRRGAFGPGAPAEVFSVKVDSENNPSANIQQGLFNVEVYFYPSRPAETIVITVGQQDGGGSASEG